MFDVYGQFRWSINDSDNVVYLTMGPRGHIPCSLGGGSLGGGGGLFPLYHGIGAPQSLNEMTDN